MRRLIPHYDYPLRRIVRREIQNKKPFVVPVCKHAEPGVPQSRYSKCYPCSTCHELVERVRKERHR